MEKETIGSILKKIGEKVRQKLCPLLRKLGLEDLPTNILLLAFKQEKILELYVRIEGAYVFLKSYPFTATSGIAGPKLKEGDKQIPEGFYQIEYLNPNSKYYLSMKINYPNDFDLQKASLEGRTDPGSDIFIHGKYKSEGCIAIGDEAIEELFVLASNVLPEPVKVLICPQNFRKNSEYPEVNTVGWSKELYDKLKSELDLYNLDY